MHNDLTGESAIDFPLGGLEQGQTAHTIRSMLGQRPDQQGPGEPFPGDDLLVAGYGYFDASTLMHLGLGEWLASEPGRCMMLILGFHGKSPLRVQDAPWQKECAALAQLLDEWANQGVPLENIRLYGIARWHVKLAATLTRFGSLDAARFGGEDPQGFEAAFSYDDQAALVGQVNEAVIGSSNATYRAMLQEGNYEFDVHIRRGHPAELARFSDKLHSMLRTAIAEVNNPRTVSHAATVAMRAQQYRSAHMKR